MPTFDPNQPSVTVRVPVPTPVQPAKQQQSQTPNSSLAMDAGKSPLSLRSPVPQKIPAGKPHALIFPLLLD
jgi:hypothetical protein